MSTSKDQKGSGHLVLILAVLLTGVIGYAGWNVMQKNKTVADTTAPAVVQQAVVPAKITNKAQATQAKTALESQKIDNTLNTTQLDADLKSVL